MRRRSEATRDRPAAPLASSRRPSAPQAPGPARAKRAPKTPKTQNSPRTTVISPGSTPTRAPCRATIRARPVRQEDRMTAALTRFRVVAYIVGVLLLVLVGVAMPLK